MVFRLYRHPRDFLLTLLSSFLLVLSFQNFGLGILAWVGLLPLFISIHGRRLIEAFCLSLACGIFLFLGISHWIFEVRGYTFIHHSILMLYLGVYFAVFGLVFSFISTRWGVTPALFAAPAIWVSLECLRSNLSFLALPWELLAHSQHSYPSVIQIASLSGAYSISFLIVLVNSALAGMTLSFLHQLKKTNQALSNLPSRRGKWALAIIAGSFIVFTLFYGHAVISQPIIGKEIKVAAVQGNIEQGKKWDPRYAREIMDTYSELTQEALKYQPDLVIWPETATPGSISLHPELYVETEDIARKAATFLLLGSAQHEKFEGKASVKFKYFNSAYLIHPGPGITKIQRYDKIRLFPFGEYLPYKEIIPWSLIGVSDSDNYVAGREFTVFTLTPFRFGVTICWENVFPDLFRHFVSNGAQFMINITNEARFGKTIAPYQLVSISVFRAVENRIFVIRCANTGVSCIINPYGQIVDRVRDGKGEDTFVRGVMNGRITPLDSKTIYNRYGDWFVWMAITISVVFLLSAIFKRSLQKLRS